MSDEGRQSIARRGLIDQHDVEAERLEGSKQFGGAARAQDKLDVAPAENRAQEGHLKIARERGERSDAKRLPCRACVAQRAEQFLASRKDRIGMIERDAAGFRHMQSTATSFEERVTQPMLELADLHRQR